MKHLCDDELERYYLGMLSESELEPLEIHLLTCSTCIDRMKEAERYVDAIRSAILRYGLDREVRSSIS
jgi:anti-sigma factor RsiW